MYRIVAFCLLAFAVADVSGQWGTARCEPVGSPVYHGWYDAGNGKAELWWKGEKIGTLNLATDEWLTDGVGKPVNLFDVFANADLGSRKLCCCGDGCPLKCKDGCGCGCNKKSVEVRGDVQNFGLDLNHMKDCSGKECFRVNGKECSRESALESIESGSVPDDSKLRRVVVLGSEGSRKRVLDDWGKGGLASFKDSAILQCYSPDHWHVKDVGYKAFADPTIYVVDAGGKVLHRQDYYDGPDKLAGALRKTDLSYDPSKDPDVNKPKPVAPDSPVAPVGTDWKTIIMAALMSVVGFLIGKKVVK